MAVRKVNYERIGTKYNNLLCVDVFWNEELRVTYGKFVCDCGSEWIGKMNAVVSGNTKSCGCRGPKSLQARNYKHGMCRTPIHMIWCSMMGRCYNPSNQRYADYGGRGITVSLDWHEFSNFYSDMGDKPDGLSVERVNNSEGYSKHNCRWATDLEQASNKRNNRYLTAYGITLPITRWGFWLGVGSSNMNQLLKKHDLEDVALMKVGTVGVEQLCQTL